MPEQPEVWLRGPIDGYHPLVQPVVHSLLQVREDLARLVRTVPEGHVRHAGGAIDRLLTYARGEPLSDLQRQALALEEIPGEPLPTLDDEAAKVNEIIERALAQVRAASPESLLETRLVGRAALPSTVLGLFVHVAEHSTRHAGQAITTARILESQ
jgi:hypothetical protein